MKKISLGTPPFFTEKKFVFQVGRRGGMVCGSENSEGGRGYFNKAPTREY